MLESVFQSYDTLWTAVNHILISSVDRGGKDEVTNRGENDEVLF